MSESEVHHRYNSYRDLVKHEDTLRGSRLQTLFAIQSVAFVAVAWSLNDAPALAVIIAFFSMYVAYYYGRDLANGHVAMANIVRTWRDDPAFAETPPVIGRFDEALKPANRITLALIVVWVAVIGVAARHYTGG